MFGLTQERFRKLINPSNTCLSRLFILACGMGACAATKRTQRTVYSGCSNTRIRGESFLMVNLLPSFFLMNLNFLLCDVPGLSPELLQPAATDADNEAITPPQSY